MNINLEYYKVFYYVCQEGSLTAAAQRLCISQPAVSQAVRQLEKEAGAKLFSRTSPYKRRGTVISLCKRRGRAAVRRRPDA
mgnify:CR=1 FL=1